MRTSSPCDQNKTSRRAPRMIVRRTTPAALQNVACDHRERCDLDPLQTHALFPGRLLLTHFSVREWEVA